MPKYLVKEFGEFQYSEINADSPQGAAEIFAAMSFGLGDDTFTQDGPVEVLVNSELFTVSMVAPPKFKAFKPKEKV